MRDEAGDADSAVPGLPLRCEQQSGEVPYTVCVPQQQEYQATVLQPVQQPFTYQVCVLKP